jgi:hypothetical protein
MEVAALGQCVKVGRGVMMKRKRAPVTVALLLVSTASLMFAACQSGTEPALDEPPGEALVEGSVRPFCGGIAGIACPQGLVCTDDPQDDCDPDDGGADCGGICVVGRRDCFVPGRRYVAEDPGQCAAIRFRCPPGREPFFDDCGCGCEPAPTGDRWCGGSLCGPHEYCCNPSCGICAPIGGACIQAVCD